MVPRPRLMASGPFRLGGSLFLPLPLFLRPAIRNVFNYVNYYYNMWFVMVVLNQEPEKYVRAHELLKSVVNVNVIC